MPAIDRIKREADLRQDWQTINKLVDAHRLLQAEVRRLSGAVEQLRNKLPHINPGGSGGGINYRGEYNPLSSYSALDMVVVSNGLYAGSYLCTEATAGSSGEYPWLGVKWVLLGKAMDQGEWA